MIPRVSTRTRPVTQSSGPCVSACPFFLGVLFGAKPRYGQHLRHVLKRCQLWALPGSLYTSRARIVPGVPFPLQCTLQTPPPDSHGYQYCCGHIFTCGVCVALLSPLQSRATGGTSEKHRNAGVAGRNSLASWGLEGSWWD